MKRNKSLASALAAAMLISTALMPAHATEQKTNPIMGIDAASLIPVAIGARRPGIPPPRPHLARRRGLSAVETPTFFFFGVVVGMLARTRTCRMGIQSYRLH